MTEEAKSNVTSLDSYRGKPIDEIPPGQQLGVLIRRARIRANKGLREVSRSLGHLGITPEVLASVECGRRPLSMDQIKILSETFGTNPAPLEQALVQFHKSVWAKREDQFVVTSQSAEATTIDSGRDIVELEAALKTSVSTMDLISGIIERCVSLIDEEKHPHDVEMIRRALILLESSVRVSEHVLDLPPMRPSQIPDPIED